VGVNCWPTPPLGDNAIVVENSFTGSNELAVSVVLLNNVAQGNALGNQATDLSTTGRTSETETLPTTSSDLVIHVIADAVLNRGTLGSGETSASVANDGLQKGSAGDGDASLWISTKPGGASSTTVSSSGWPNGPVPSPRPLNALAFAVHGAAIIPVPDLAVASSHPGAFTQGQAGAVYILTASNIGTAPTV